MFSREKIYRDLLKTTPSTDLYLEKYFFKGFYRNKTFMFVCKQKIRQRDHIKRKRRKTLRKSPRRPFLNLLCTGNLLKTLYSLKTFYRRPLYREYLLFVFFGQTKVYSFYRQNIWYWPPLNR